MSRYPRRPIRPFALALAALAALAGPALATMPPVSGRPPAEVATAFRDGLFDLPARPVRLGVSATLPTWRIPVILVSFTDDSLTYSAADFDTALFDTTHATPTGSLYDYYRWASGNRLSVAGHVVATVHLPHDKFYYGYNSWGLSRTSTPHNVAGMVRDALVACNSQVVWSDFDLDRDGFVDMLWVVHAGIGGEASPNRYDNDVWSITSRLAGYWTGTSAYETWEFVPGSTTQHIRVDRFSTLPELSYFAPGHRSEIGVFCHEFGHALGLPDLFDTRDAGASNSGPGNWSLMGTGVYGGDGHSPQYPTHLGAWPSLFMGWGQAVRPGTDTPLVLAPLGSGSQILDLSFQGESDPEHFLVEARRREGFDRNLPADGLVVYHVDEGVIGQGLQSNTVNSGLTPGLVVVEADGASDLTRGINRGDAGDPFPGSSGRTHLSDTPQPPNTLTFAGNPTNTGLSDIALVPQGVSFTAQVRAAGWEPAVDRTVGAYAPADAQTPACTSVLAPDGTGYSVASETRSGRLQVVLRTRRGGAWDAGLVVSNSSGNAFEPALTLLGTDDIAVVWSDTRLGAARPYYRARVGGVWMDEQLLGSVAGEYHAPSVGADGRGGIHVAWTFVGQDLPRVQYMRFPYLSPYGQPFTLSGPGALPSNPIVAVLPRGGAIVIWTDSATWPTDLWFSRCAPDSLPAAPLTLAPDTDLPRTWVSALAESSGAIHVVWIASASTTSELHYQRRQAWGVLAPADTTLETSNNTLSKARLVRDPAGGLHVVCERSVNGVTQVRYRRRDPALGWDAFSTDVTPPDGNSAVQPSVLASSPGSVVVLYRGYDGGVPRFMERSRITDQPGVLAVAPAVAAPSPARLALVPNPVRAGRDVVVDWSPAPGADPGSRAAAEVDVFDLAGRRVAVVTLEARGTSLRGRLEGSLTRPWLAGIYFLRPRGVVGPVQRLVVLR